MTELEQLKTRLEKAEKKVIKFEMLAREHISEVPEGDKPDEEIEWFSRFYNLAGTYMGAGLNTLEEKVTILTQQVNQLREIINQQGGEAPLAFYELWSEMQDTLKQ